MSETATGNMATRIALGSGKIYVTDVPESLDLTDVDALIASYAKAVNEFGAVKNGATLSYTPTVYTAEDDLGRFSKTVVQSDVATLAAGVMTINGNTFAVLVDTGKVSTTTGGNTVIKIGGAANAKNKSYLVIFEHLDAKDGNIYVILVGKNTAELSLAFAQGAETILNPTFTAEAMDGTGVKVIILMQKPTAKAS